MNFKRVKIVLFLLLILAGLNALILKDAFDNQDIVISNKEEVFFKNEKVEIENSNDIDFIKERTISLMETNKQVRDFRSELSLNNFKKAIIEFILILLIIIVCIVDIVKKSKK